jgi:hypothetical protein
VQSAVPRKYPYLKCLQRLQGYWNNKFYSFRTGDKFDIKVAYLLLFLPDNDYTVARNTLAKEAKRKVIDNAP